MKNTTIVIILIVAVLLLIGVGVWAAQSSKTVVTPPVTPTPTPNTTGTDILSAIGSIFNKLFGKTTPPPYKQVPPIDEEGCDALGYNKLGVKCFSAF